MKLDKLVGERFKERPKDCFIDSHALMLRGGYIKYVGSGIYSQGLPLRRITRKIEQIIREEMDAAGGQEVLFPVVLPALLWQESGRYNDVDDTLVRFNDRGKAPHVLAMTHEEAAVHFARDYAQTYAKYPFMIYQLQTKFRDELRPRGGLIRVREFTMKDAYSFHTSQEDLERYYDICFKAYERIFARVGIPEVISVISDSGMMGGAVSHEFMLLTPAGEDSVAVCGNCGYSSNVEAADNITRNIRSDVSEPMVLVHTPNVKTIDEVCEFLSVAKENCCKAVVYQKNKDNARVVVFLRGDFEINEAKLKKYLGCDIYPAVITEKSGISAGYIGPVRLADGIEVLFDNSLKNANNLVCGGNKDEYHYTGFDIQRDVPNSLFSDFSKITESGICPKCGKTSISVSNGIEVGNIFQLGTKYTKPDPEKGAATQMQYLDSDGIAKHPVMGCYGIGVGRLAACVCEARHDEHGPIWPMSIAPWQVHICALRCDNTDVSETSAALYNDLLKAGVEVIYDDRLAAAGVMFADADLLGVPIRVILSPKTVEKGTAEIKARDKSFSENVPVGSAAEYIKDLIVRMQADTD